MVFSKKKKQVLKKGLVSLVQIGVKVPEVGDIRMTKKFAFLPVKIFYDPSDIKYEKEINQYVWLETYFKKERYSKGLKFVNVQDHGLGDLYDNRRMVDSFKWVHTNNYRLDAHSN